MKNELTGRRELCVKIAAYYGLRRSEVLGLKWDAVDVKDKSVSVCHKVIEVEQDGKFVPVGEDVLKTKSSFRTMPLLPEVEKLLHPSYVTMHFGGVINKYDLKKLRFHDLRHTCASLLLKSGVPMKQIQLWLGHSTFATAADIYAHLDFGAKQESAAAIASAFEPAPVVDAAPAGEVSSTEETQATECSMNMSM